MAEPGAPISQPPTPDNIDAAAALLRAGGLVAFPTETVYGLGADATDDRAVAALFAAKGRPRFNPLIIHFTDAEAAQGQAEFDRRADDLARAFWPGPLTLVLRRGPKTSISLLASAGLDTMAVRVPGHEIAQALLGAVGRPLAAPSANRSGEISPTRAAHVAASLGDAPAMILDGGPCALGIESAVVDLSGGQARLLRPGAVTREDIEAVIGTLLLGEHVSDAGVSGADNPGGAVKSPGLAGRHYAPDRPLRIEAKSAASGEAFLAFGPHAPACGGPSLNLSPAGDLEEAAANLFAMLRALDRPGVAAIAVMAVPEAGLGAAINDRLRRAAAGLADPEPTG